MLELLGVLAAAALTCASPNVPCSATPMIANPSLERQALVVPKPVQKPRQRVASQSAKTDIDGKSSKSKAKATASRTDATRSRAERNRLVLLIGNYY
jgi:hypothetical protein